MDSKNSRCIYDSGNQFYKKTSEIKDVLLYQLETKLNQLTVFIVCILVLLISILIFISTTLNDTDLYFSIIQYVGLSLLFLIMLAYFIVCNIYKKKIEF